MFNDHAVRSFVAPDDASFYFGADRGFSRDPTVLVRCFLGRWSGAPGTSDVITDQKGRSLFVDYATYEIGCSIVETHPCSPDRTSASPNDGRTSSAIVVSPAPLAGRSLPTAPAPRRLII